MVESGFSLNLSFINTHLSFSVIVGPHLVKVLEDQILEEGEGLDLACVVSGDPPPTISWRGPTGPLLHRGSILHISQVQGFLKKHSFS